MNAIRIGCSGWQYRHWRGDLYPKGLPQDRWFEFYAERFDTVELNNSFYRLPAASVFAGWGRRSPAGFLFAVKASRYLTHLRRLNRPREPLHRFWSRAERLGDHLGPVLYQLPPRWHRNAERLGAFADAVPSQRPQAVELRDASWYHPDTYDAMARADLALCLHDMRGSESPREPIGPFVYVRFHGSDAKYAGSYSGQALAAWADRLAAWAAGGLPCYAYFNNDVGGHAFRDAIRLREMVARRVKCDSQVCMEDADAMPELFPWLLFLHVLAAIIAFGPTFAFPIIGAMSGHEPQHANFAVRATHRVGDVLVEPFAISMFITGALMIWSAGIPVFERDARWLLVAIVLYLVALLLSLFVSRPNVKKVIAMSTGDGPPSGPPPPEMLNAISIVQRAGMVLLVLLIAIVFLMVVKPDFGF